MMTDASENVASHDWELVDDWSRPESSNHEFVWVCRACGIEGRARVEEDWVRGVCRRRAEPPAEPTLVFRDVEGHWDESVASQTCDECSVYSIMTC